MKIQVILLTALGTAFAVRGGTFDFGSPGGVINISRDLGVRVMGEDLFDEHALLNVYKPQDDATWQ